MNSRRVSGGFLESTRVRRRHTCRRTDLGIGRVRLRALRLADEGFDAAVRRDRNDGTLVLRELAVVDVRRGSGAHRRGVLVEETVLNWNFLRKGTGVFNRR